MIKIENTEVVGWEHAVRGMRNPMNSWDKSDSRCVRSYCFTDENRILDDEIDYVVGNNDLTLMKKLASNGPVHAKYRRMIVVYVDITAPLYWWKEFDTYKVGTVANSCSTMHKIQEKEFTLDDFSCEHLDDDRSAEISNLELLEWLIRHLNSARNLYLETKDKKYWWQMIQLLPSSYNQKRTVMMNYEMLANAYKWRNNHKLDEWREFCKWIELLPYSELITGGGSDGKQE